MQVQTIVPLMTLLYKVFMGLLVAGGIGIIMWPFRSIRKEWRTLKDSVAETHAELVTQRTNCLTTLQNQGDRQIELLGKAVETLGNIHTSQAAMSGFMQATQIIAAPTRRKR
jgi:hypothetical protein